MATHFSYPDQKLRQELRRIATALTQPGKGILAADENEQTMDKRFADISIENTVNNRRKYRQLLFNTKQNIQEHISGVILYEETFYQHADDGTSMIDLLRNRNIIPGITVDKGVVPLMGSEKEFTTQGLDQLSERCAKFKKGGCDFAKWRCVFNITENTPSHQAMLENANVLARYASICQMNGMVPIIQPEVIPAGSHSLERAQKVTEKVLAFLYKALNDHHIYLEGTLLKQNVVMPGQNCKTKYTAATIAKATVQAVYRTVPPAVQGIVFLSGGETEEVATLYLDAINRSNAARKPWVLTFSFGGALQHSCLRAWDGEDENIKQAQEQFYKRAKANGAAAQGMYDRY